jgi:phage protein D
MTPKELKDTHKVNGLRSVVINNKTELENVKEGYGIIIAANVGKLKKIEILKAAKDKKIFVFNVKDIDSFLKKTDEELKKKKQEKEKKAKEKEKKEAEKKKKAEEKKKDEGLDSKVVSEDEKKEAEKKEKDKLLISTE